MSGVQNYIQTVALRDVKCYAFHGYYPEEQLTGIYFMVDVVVTFTPNTDTENLERTVNYEILNNIILDEMKNTRKMLETVVKVF
ncbi:dihydroneopterin aldolase [Pedobacter steynii]